MEILHISAECYPAAKAGGLGDVTGSLPKYLNRQGHSASVVIPKYKTGWINARKTTTVFKSKAPYDMNSFSFAVERVEDAELEFTLYLVSIPGKFDREGIYTDPWSGYPFWDEMDRFFCFQIAVLDWINHLKQKPDIIHTHDHHTSLIPFMMTQCYRYGKLASIPTVATIHNGEYQGRYDRSYYTRLPAFNLDTIGLLDWDGDLNALAAGIKCAWRITTVSRGYLKELMGFCHGLEHLLRAERQKAFGLVNGIDVDVWNPETDPMIHKNFSFRSRKAGKRANKQFLCREFKLESKRPLFSFIGRLVREKGADLIPDVIETARDEGLELSFVVLGTGDQELHQQLSRLKGDHAGYFDTRLEYNEQLAHTIYAGSDFLLMPSRVEPCGLNQMYAMRYGTMPVVRSTGGLADTVTDITEKDGFGIMFEEFSLDAVMAAVRKAVDFYRREERMAENVKRLMKRDYSWEKSSKEYIKLYKNINS